MTILERLAALEAEMLELKKLVGVVDTPRQAGVVPRTRHDLRTGQKVLLVDDLDNSYGREAVAGEYTVYQIEPRTYSGNWTLRLEDHRGNFHWISFERAIRTQSIELV